MRVRFDFLGWVPLSLMLVGCPSPYVEPPIEPNERPDERQRVCGAASSDAPDAVVVDSGARYGHPVPSDAVWVPNPNVSQSREYWRVFANPDGVAYIVPHIDRSPQHKWLCERPELADAMAPLAQCESGGVENLPVDSALRITTALHQRLRFRPDPYQPGQVWPPPMIDDLLEVCCDETPVPDDYRRAACRRLHSLGAGRWQVLRGGDVRPVAEGLNILYGM